MFKDAIRALNGSTSAAAISRHMPQSDDTEGGTGITFMANPDCLQALSALITIRAVLKTAVLVGCDIGYCFNQVF